MPEALLTAQRTPRVLVADDEKALTKSIARILGGAGYEVVTVPDGEQALVALKQGEFDVVLSDIQMPGMSGVELLRSVREHDLDVPVILMTADPRVETAADAVELGALQYLVKPIAVDALVKSLQRASKLYLMARMKRQTQQLIGTLDQEEKAREKLSESFDRALSGLWMAFQPIVDRPGVPTFGYEALLRSSEASLPHPGAVLEAAERLDRLTELGRRIRELVAREIDALDPQTLVFVNLHARDLLDPMLITKHAPLSRHATRVVLEITERAALDEIKDIRARIAALRALGYRIAVDDLGAGYAGLTSFALLEPDYVKFDMSLVRNVDTSPIRKKLIGSMTALCKEMGMMVVAEGIETIAERDAIQSLGCDLLQGFLFGRPARPFPVPAFPPPTVVGVEAAELAGRP